MNSQLVDIFLLSLLAMFNPSLLAAVTVMLLLPNPKRLMVGYLLGAYTTSITVGLLIVFALHGSGTESTSKHTIGPVEDIVLGLLLVALAIVLGTGRDRPYQERRREKKDAKLKAKQEAGKPTESLPLRMLGKGDPKVTFVVGLVLSFPGVSYLDALDHIHKLNPGTVPTVLLVIGFCLIQQLPARDTTARLRVRVGPHAGRDRPVQGLDGPPWSHRCRDRRRRDRCLATRQGTDHVVVVRERRSGSPRCR
jgi:hypothetical protein